MGNKIWVTGATMVLAGPVILGFIPAVVTVGAVLMVIGTILIILDK